MTSRNFVRVVAIFCITLMLPFGSGSTWAQVDAQSKKRVDLKGRIYDFDKDTPLRGVTVRIVSTETGQAFETFTDKNGCYEFESIPDGTYSLSVFYKGSDAVMAEKVRGEFLLSNKIPVRADVEKDIVIKTCASLAEKNSLILMDDCDLCGKISSLVLIIPAGVMVGGVLVGRADDDASPSRP